MTSVPLADKSADWFEVGLGGQLLQSEIALFPSLVPPNYYAQGACLQAIDSALCQPLNVGCLTRVGASLRQNVDVVALPEHLPFGENSIDLMLLPHTLDYCENPVTTLREVSQALNAEGIVVLTGFNPMSLLGLTQKLSLKKRPPYSARFIALKVVQDWLTLLGFTLLGASMLEYRPLVANEKIRRKLAFLNQAGDRWWPTTGGVYVLVVKKQIYSKINAKRQTNRRRDWLKIRHPIPVDIKKLMSRITIYTDGACRGNPGIGGWGALLIYGDKERELKGVQQDTTNNQMELAAAIESLKVLKHRCEVDLYTDSTYVKNGITQWIATWRQRGWKTAAKKPVKNVALWKQLDQLNAKHTVSWHWVKGHAGIAGNERADALANQAIDERGLEKTP